MVALLQRVNSSSIWVNDKIVDKINKGILVLIGINCEDDIDDMHVLIKKILNFRIFEDENKKMNLSVKNLKLDIMVISQFTLCADIKKGNRPSFNKAAPIDKAEKLYNMFVKLLKQQYENVKSGVFRTTMNLKLINNGPATFLIDTKKL